MIPKNGKQYLSFVFSLHGDPIVQGHHWTLHGVMWNVKGSIIEHDIPNEYPMI